jgi:adenylate kinase family enzyme
VVPQTFIFIGRSGSGKGTQAKLLIEYLKSIDPERSIFYLETGEVFRKLVAGESHTSKLAAEIYKKGALQPEFLAVWAWSNVFVENLIGGEHLVIDGTPRKPREAHVLDSAMSFYERLNPNVIHVSVSREWSTEKLTARMRGDDTPLDIENRLNWFDTDVAPAIDYFRNNAYYAVHEVNGEQPIEKVHADILAAIEWPK